VGLIPNHNHTPSTVSRQHRTKPTQRSYNVKAGSLCILHTEKQLLSLIDRFMEGGLPFCGFEILSLGTLCMDGDGLPILTCGGGTWALSHETSADILIKMETAHPTTTNPEP
jgi:hypothetical protein